VTLSAPGSYRLTGNLDVRVLGSSGNVVDVTADEVSLDLSGFAILGSTVCTGTPPKGDLTCAPRASNHGIYTNGHRGARITNGNVRGVGYHGIYCDTACEVSAVRVSDCYGYGIYAGDGSIVRGNVVQRNGFAGIRFNDSGGLTITGNTAAWNGNHGIWAGSGDVVEGNTSVGNRAAGIYASGASTVRNNVARSNGGDGIYSGLGNIIEGNTAHSNAGRGIFANGSSLIRGNTALSNGSAGIYVSTGGLVVNNVANTNAGFGIEFTTAYGTYEDNMIRGNTAGTVSGGTPMGLNFCNTGTTCP
jgi:parallel beta-helix repeat protein